jgi:hypothetical protein
VDTYDDDLRPKSLTQAMWEAFPDRTWLDDTQERIVEDLNAWEVFLKRVTKQ